MTEQRLEKILRREVEKIKGKALKFTSPGTRGVPDRLILLPEGRAVFAELKAPGKKLRPLQQKRKKQLENLGFKVYVIDSLIAIDKFLQEAIHGVHPT